MGADSVTSVHGLVIPDAALLPNVADEASDAAVIHAGQARHGLSSMKQAENALTWCDIVLRPSDRTASAH